jgi:uncharacterized protein YaeQ
VEKVVVTSSNSTFEPNRMDTPLTEIMRTGLYREIEGEKLFIVTEAIGSTGSGHDARMALGATLYNFDIELADSDRHVYESLALRVAQHPSESEEYLIARVLAYLLEFAEGIEFSSGVSDPDEPTIAIRNPTGAITAWIDVGTPDAARLHKASKAAGRVAVYTHKEPTQFLKRLADERIHRAEALELYAIDRPLVSALVTRLERRVAFSVSITDRELYISIGKDTVTGAVARLIRA